MNLWALILVALCSAGLVRFAQVMMHNRELEKRLANVPTPKIKYPFSQFVELLSGWPWDVLWKWTKELGPVMRFQFGTSTYMVISDPTLIEHVLARNRENYLKDRESYNPFMVLLGTGLITSEGLNQLPSRSHLILSFSLCLYLSLYLNLSLAEHWFKQRGLVAPVLRVGILQETAVVSIAAADRLALKLSRLQVQHKHPEVQMGEEFRHLTLQVIGKSILSMSPEHCDSVFPQLYLPIADEANKRVYFPWRAFLPTPSFFEFNSAVRKLNEFVTNLIEKRVEQLAPHYKNIAAIPQDGGINDGQCRFAMIFFSDLRISCSRVFFFFFSGLISHSSSLQRSLPSLSTAALWIFWIV